jgi:adenylate cyclase class 2
MGTKTLEREIKLPFASAVEARDAILRTKATLLRGRRLQEDCLVLRVRSEQGRSLLTYKGPVQPSPFKLREERETVVADGETMRYILEQLGYTVWFRYEKYREEFGARDAIIALDETPIGTFVEIEGSQQAIETIAVDLGRAPADYIVDSYRGLYVRHCAATGRPVGDMVFEE